MKYRKKYLKNCEGYYENKNANMQKFWSHCEIEVVPEGFLLDKNFYNFARKSSFYQCRYVTKHKEFLLRIEITKLVKR